MIIMTIFRLFKPPRKEELWINLQNIFKLDLTFTNETYGIFTQYMDKKNGFKRNCGCDGFFVET